MTASGDWQVKVRLGKELTDQVNALAKRRRLSVGRLVESLLKRELDETDSGALPDENAIREMATLLAVELSVKLQEANTPGGRSLSDRLLDSAAETAIGRLDMVAASLRVERD